uniref:AT-rich interactive domain-containing protein 3 n=1 Tax=Chelonoidis abingdonii TaxID=106734 RepID=A0A8C0J2G5_CHEAB
MSRDATSCPGCPWPLTARSWNRMAGDGALENCPVLFIPSGASGSGHCRQTGSWAGWTFGLTHCGRCVVLKVSGRRSIFPALPVQVKEGTEDGCWIGGLNTAHEPPGPQSAASTSLPHSARGQGHWCLLGTVPGQGTSDSALGGKGHDGPGDPSGPGAGYSWAPSIVPQDSSRRCLLRPLYELDDDPKRKEFLDDLFGFMQKRGTPVNRIPIMAKQVLDLYVLYRLVTEKGGLVEVINKKIWREITKGLNLPTSITSAAFTLRTQYMKYLYPYECEKQALSSPGELQAAIDSNRREGRRQSFGTALFSYSPVGTPAMLASPKIPVAGLAISTHSCSQMSQVHAIKKEDGILSAAVPSRITIPVSLAGHHIAAAQAAAASQAAALEQLREKLETGEPPEKKMTLMAEEQQRLMQHALQQNLLAMASQFPMNIKLSSRDDRQETALNLSTNGISSINMSIEINGVVYTASCSARLLASRPGPAPGTRQQGGGRIRARGRAGESSGARDGRRGCRGDGQRGGPAGASPWRASP